MLRQTYRNSHNAPGAGIECQRVETRKCFIKVKDYLKKLKQFNFFGNLPLIG